MRHRHAHVNITDPSALRALAHPLRLRILGSLRADGPQTVGKLSGRLDAAPGSISYHLGTLEKHGLVELAPELARDRRERWWRATAESTRFDPAAAHENPEQQAAGRAMRTTIVHGYAAALLAYLESEETLDRAWVAAGTIGDSLAWLTVEELAEMSRELEELSARWAERSARDTGGARTGAHPVTIQYAAYRRP